MFRQEKKQNKTKTSASEGFTSDPLHNKDKNRTYNSAIEFCRKWCASNFMLGPYTV